MSLRRAPLLVAIAAVAAFDCAPAPRRTTAVTVVADPGRFGSIATAAAAEARVDWWDADLRDDQACTASFAATELARYLPACLGLPENVVRLAATAPDTGDVIVVGDAGSSRVVRSLVGAPDPRSATAGGFRLRALERRGGRILVIAGDDRAGALYGAYALLERLGMRFVGLGDSGTVVPRAPAPWPARLAIAERPAFATRGFWAWEPRGNHDFFLWMARNRMNLWSAADTAYVPLMKKLGFRLTGGGHTIEAEFLGPDRYFASHPEWYGLHDARRSPAIHGESGDNFCTSNPAARAALADNVVAALIGGSLERVDLLELWMLDGGRWCECDACRAEGTPTDRWLDVANQVAAAADAAWRDGRLARRVEVAAPAYLETLAPPTRDHREAPGSAATVTFFPYFRCYAHALLDSSCVEINRRLATAYRGWEAARVPWAVCEYYDVAAFKSLPLVFPHVMARDLAAYRTRAGASGGWMYMHAPTRLWGCWTLNHRLLGQLTWNPDANVDTLIAGFFRDYFPAAAAAMREHYRALERASANILALQACAGVYGTSAGSAGRLAQTNVRLFPLRHLQPTETHPATDDAPDLDEIERAMGEARAALDRAQASPAGPSERARLAEEARRFGYGEAMFGFYIGLIRTAERERAGDADGARAEFAAVEQAATTLRGVTDLVQVSASHANARDGLEASGVAGTYQFFRKRYGG